MRVLDPAGEPLPGVNDHLPTGYGRPVVWVEDLADLLAEVQATIGGDGGLERLPQLDRAFGLDPDSPGVRDPGLGAGGGP